MFGKRLDGRRIRDIDPIVKLTPYLMPQRCDAQVFTRRDLDFEAMTRYIREKRKEGHENVTYMTILIAAFVRMAATHPEINRFIVNKRLYARNQITISITVLKKNNGDKIEEALIKPMFDPKDTIFDVCDRVSAAIEEARKPEEDNLPGKIAKALFAIPKLPNIIVSLVRFLDNHDMMPKLIQEASPFHTSLFITNVASLGMNYVFHHIYNFGTTSLFIGMGKAEQQVHANSDGTCRSRRMMPLGIVIDERIASGAEYAIAVSEMCNYVAHPELLEVPGDKFVSECDFLPVPPPPKPQAE